MKIRLYLNAVTARLDVNQGGVMVFRQYNVNRPNKDEPFIQVEGNFPEMKKLPESLQDGVVSRVSVHETFYGGGVNTSREMGEYQYRTALGCIERDASGLHHMRVEGKEIVDVSMLFSFIRSGSIAPFRSYEQEQIKSNLGVKEALQQLWQIICHSIAQKHFELTN